MTAVAVAKASEIGPGRMRIVEAGGERIALCNVDGTFHAVQDVCTHDEGPLGEGTLKGNALECPRHGARFDVRTGAVVRMPAIVPVKVYPVRVEGGDVLIEVET